MNFIGDIAEFAGKVFDKIFPNKAEAEKAKQEFTLELIKNENDLKLAAAKNIQTESASTHWLAANWRPLTMLTFVFLIVARFFGFTAPNISEAEYIKLWELMEIGIGGYIAGRSVEKIAPKVVDKLKK